MQSWCIGWNFCKHTEHNQSHFLLEYTSWFIWKINYKHYFCYMQHVRKIFMLKLGLSKPCSVAQCFYSNVCWITHMKYGQHRHNVIYAMKYNTCGIAYSNETMQHFCVSNLQHVWEGTRGKWKDNSTFGYQQGGKQTNPWMIKKTCYKNESTKTLTRKWSKWLWTRLLKPHDSQTWIIWKGYWCTLSSTELTV